jgi:N12 class adenine-specific DNA methylase/CheY-like chemotaxis protein
MFRPSGQGDLAPAGVAAKLAANLAALEVVDACERDSRSATVEEQAVLARWAGWGAIPHVFDEDDTRYTPERNDLRRLLGSDEAWAQARRTVLNAHYTDAIVVQAIWDTATRLGLTRGRVLEPGCGSGNFIGFAPPSMSMVGVELDATTASIARHLYQATATVHTGGFEDYKAPEGSFDAAIGNVPFAKITPHDPAHNRGRHSLHNYFLIKSLRLVRPGGMVLALTSRYTLDARNPGARRELAGLADLVGAVRFPSGAFAAAADTKAVIDLLVLRRREADIEPSGPDWSNTVGTEQLGVEPAAGEQPVSINEYFAARPSMVLGDVTIGRGMYAVNELLVRATGSLGPQLAEALETLVNDAHARNAVFAPAIASTALRSAVPEAVGEFDLRFAQEGSFVTGSGGRVARFSDGDVIAYAPRVGKDTTELARLVGLRDAAREVLAIQVDGGADADLDAAQRGLADRYSTYHRLYGPINRFTTARTGRFDPDTGAEVNRRIRPRMGGFRDDPHWPLVAALEDFDDETQTARRAAIFTDRVISPPPQRLGVDTPAEAVAVCLDETGAVTLERVAELLGSPVAETRRQLDGLVFDDPATGQLEPAERYLSGNIRDKLAVVGIVAADDPTRWQPNIDALTAAMPRQLEPGEITARLGASWIPPSDVEAFCREALDAAVDVERLVEIGQWSVKLRDGSRGSVSLTSEWGTTRADAIALLDAGLNQRLHTVWDQTEDGRRVRNDSETLAARAKQDAIAERFTGWVWEHPERATRLAGRYNELFCSVRLPTYDGSHLSLPGLADTFTPRQHQRDAVARILQDGRALLAHSVGAGKTATMVIAAMELRRLGSVTKPAVVVPNHMLDQFSREWLQLYPTARILVADKERLSKERRKEFIARCATGEWDGIVFTQSGFSRLPLGHELTAEYTGRELAAARAALNSSRDGKGISVKRLERRVAQMEEKYKALLAEHTKDDGVRFEETGIDFVFVDEAHAYKNRRIDSSIDGVANSGSQRAQDLDAKLWALRTTNGPRSVCFATATPVANSMAELWVMQSYLQPDLLEHVEMGVFDGWAATFGRTHTMLELAPDGVSYRMQTRFSRFQNVPELLTLYRQVADVRTAADLDLPVPNLIGGKAETVVVPPSNALVHYVADLAERAEQVRSRAVNPSEDNMLAITGDGRRAALDLRLVGHDPDPEGGKVTVAAQRIAAIHHASSSRTYLDTGGRPALRPGGLQLVFCDVSTPAGDGWNAYDELRTQLVQRGVPAESIHYMQDAKNDQAKARLFTACRDGTVNVLIGSTETMGVGTNVQARAVAMHHLDAPWRPADIEQRDGRIMRQGNQNPDVQIVRYVTEGSFDTYMWQGLERKAAFISQVTRGDLPDRDVDDIGDQALSYAEIKALSTGDPRIMEKAGVDADVARLTRLQRAHQDDQHRLRTTLASSEQRARRCTNLANDLEAAAAQVNDTHGNRFHMIIDGTSHAKRVDAGTHLKAILANEFAITPSDAASDVIPVGEVAGLTVHAQTDRRSSGDLRLRITSAHIELTYTRDDWQQAEPARIVQRLERHIQSIPDDLTAARKEALNAATEAERARARLGQPFEHADQLARLQRRQAELNEALTPADPSQSQRATETSVAEPTPADGIRRRLDALARRDAHVPQATGQPIGGV